MARLLLLLVSLLLIAESVFYFSILDNLIHGLNEHEYEHQWYYVIAKVVAAFAAMLWFIVRGLLTGTDTLEEEPSTLVKMVKRLSFIALIISLFFLGLIFIRMYK